MLDIYSQGLLIKVWEGRIAKKKLQIKRKGNDKVIFDNNWFRANIHFLSIKTILEHSYRSVFNRNISILSYPHTKFTKSDCQYWWEPPDLAWGHTVFKTAPNAVLSHLVAFEWLPLFIKFTSRYHDIFSWVPNILPI